MSKKKNLHITRISDFPRLASHFFIESKLQQQQQRQKTRKSRNKFYRRGYLSKSSPSHELKLRQNRFRIGDDTRAEIRTKGAKKIFFN